MKRVATVLNVVLGMTVGLLLFSQFSFRQSENRNAGFTPPPLPKQLSFAGEAVPLDRWEVGEKMDRELLLNYYSPGTILYLMKLANRNFPIISERLKANGVPDDFKYLCIAESNMQAWARSSAGAVGYWQFLSGTGKGYGLESNEQVDHRQDLIRSTDAACRYLKDAYNRFGNWTAAAASYNCGMGGYAQQASFQRTKNYYDLYLPEETNKYIFRILTFKYLLENGAALGFHLNEADKYPPLPTRPVNVSTPIPDLADWALRNGTTYKMLRVLNPWIKGRSLSASAARPYVIHLPAERDVAER